MSKALHVQINSFSYKRSLPPAANEHGGGHLFDCRCLINPGRIEVYKTQSGLDEGVRHYLDEQAEVDQFFGHAIAIVRQSLDRYLERGFDSLQVGFGCTGGQHRSVYCTERCAQWIRSTYPQVAVTVVHQGLQELGMVHESSAS